MKLDRSLGSRLGNPARQFRQGYSPDRSSTSQKGLGSIGLSHQPSLPLPIPLYNFSILGKLGKDLGTKLFTIHPLLLFIRLYSSGQPQTKEDSGLKELEPLKLPGKLTAFTGNVMYPNEESAVWDVNGMFTF